MIAIQKLKLRYLLIFILKVVVIHCQVPAQGTCGQQTTQPSINGATLNRIINGADAISSSWPWMVSIRQMPTPTTISTHICGGVLIYENIVLTAAHCVSNLAAENIGVIIGINNIATDTPNFNTNLFSVSSRYFHESYSESLIRNDIAILQLSTNVTLSDTVALACLPASSANSGDVIGQNVVLTGWGSTTGVNSAAALATQLQQVTIQVITPTNTQICSVNIFQSSTQYCSLDTQNTGSQGNACFGDSGGPLMWFTNNMWFVYGIDSYVTATSSPSFSSGICDNTQASYYTQVPAFLDWLGNTALPFVASSQVQPIFSFGEKTAFNSYLFLLTIVALIKNLTL